MIDFGLGRKFSQKFPKHVTTGNTGEQTNCREAQVRSLRPPCGLVSYLKFFSWRGVHINCLIMPLGVGNKKDFGLKFEHDYSNKRKFVCYWAKETDGLKIKEFNFRYVRLFHEGSGE